MFYLRAAKWFAMLSMAIGFTSPAFGSNPVYYVQPNGSNTDGLTYATAFTQISKAITVVTADYNSGHPNAGGETIDVYSGTYNGGVAISIQATAANPVLIQAYGGGSMPEIITGTGFAGINIEPPAAYITFHGFNIVGNAANYSLANAQAAENDPSGYPQYNTACIDIDGSGADAKGLTHQVHITIDDNTISYCTGAGVQTIEADYITIQYNTIYGTANFDAYGESAVSMLHDYDSNNGRGTFLVLANTIYNNQEFIPWTQGGSPNPKVITDGEGIIVDTNRNSNYDSGVTIPQYHGTTNIVNNVIYSNGSSAITVFASDNVNITNNSTYGNVQDQGSPLNNVGTPWVDRPELSISKSTGGINVLTNNFVSTLSTNYPVCIASDSVSSVYMVYNLFYNTALGSGSANCSTTPTDGKGNYFKNPLYRNVSGALSTYNLIPQTGSPALTAGYDNLWPAKDRNAVSRTGQGYPTGAYANATN